jgi:hypothetical protein
MVAVLMALALTPARAAETSATFDFITHNEIHIAASPAQVWPHLRNVNAWKEGAKAVYFDGGKDAVGERFKASSDPTAANFYFIETVELAPEKRWTIRLNTSAGDLMGYATWTLAADAGGTLLRYDTFLRSQLAAGATPEGTNRTSGQRMDSEFSRLKQLVETARAQQ